MGIVSMMGGIWGLSRRSALRFDLRLLLSVNPSGSGRNFGRVGRGLGFQDYFDAVVFFLVEDLVGVGGIGQGEFVGDDVVEADFALLDPGD